MKENSVPLHYACFECRKCFKRKQYSATYNNFMTEEQCRGQQREVEEYNESREYKCPDCGGVTYYMGMDFKSPKKSDTRAWKKAKEFIEAGKVYYRGSQDK